MRFGEVFRYEFGYRLRSPSTWAYAAFLFLVMCWGLAATADGGEVVKANSPQGVAQGTVLFGGLFGLLVSAALFGDAAIRDVTSGMDPLLYTTRLRKAEYLGGRFLAALAMNAIVVLAIPLGLFVATVTIAEADAVGPNRLAAYVQPLLLLLLPNLVLVGAILFTIGALARQTIPVYLGAIGIFISYMVAANYWTGIESPMLSTLADPLGINALLAMTRYWTPVELATRLLGFPAMLLWNRVLWLAVAAGMFAVLHRGFRFAHTDGGGRRRKGRRVTAEAPAAGRWAGAVPQIAGVFGLRTRVRQTLAVARQSLAEVMSGRAFQVAFVGTIGLVLLWGWNLGDTAFDTSTWPVTHLVIAEVLSTRSILIPWLVIALYAGELVWKDREVGTAEIADAVPVPTAIALLGRFLALVAIILVFHAAFMVGGVLLQALQGYHNFELGLYVRVLFGLNLADHVLLAALAMTVHVLVNQKYLGHIVVLAACLLGVIARPMGLPYLLVYNSGPRWTYSDMNGFGPFLGPFVWFKLYWAAWALLLGVVAILFWVRGREPGVRRRIAQARARLHGPTAKVAGVAAALILALGGFVYYNTSILNDNPSRSEEGRPQAEYERRYARFEDLPQPVIVAADLRLELYPEEPAVDMRGFYRLVNRTGAAIDSIHVVIDRNIAARSISLDRAAKPVVVDEETGYRIFALEQALQPGDSLRLSFDAALRPRGFRSKGIQTAVVGNGTYFDRRWLPFVGYQPWFELSDAAARKRFGLEPRESMPDPGDAEARRYDEVVRNEGRVQVETIVGTAADQTAIVTGVLRRRWTENGRRYFHYGTDVPVPFGTAVFSARYAVVEDRWKDVALQILHHPEHRYNVDRMVEGLKASLDYHTRTFGPYQYRQLRIVEIPPYSINGRAMVTAIALAEQNFITRADGGRVDHTFFGTVHEVAHSWWGGQLRGAHVRGRAVLSETLANYSSMMVTEKVLGPEEARRVYDFQMDRYLRMRAEFSRDVPLLDVEDHPHIAYGKGAVAMYTLREHIGDEAVNTALRRLLEKHRDGGPPYPTSRDLLAELRAVTPDSLRYLLTDLFETITLWDVRTRSAVAEPAGTGAYQVTLDVVAKKLRADSVGKETEVPMNDLVEIGVFAPGEGDGAGKPLYLKRHRIRGGGQTIRITVPQEPGRAGIDPWRKLIDREREDNVVEVQAVKMETSR
ncbi:MAG TPA: M1 family aminopeptidase [Thermoanaerobaculia bacterium]|nr:M1 family aminopeptidase [Thermoanaerobaculia bacterium]